MMVIRLPGSFDDKDATESSQPVQLAGDPASLENLTPRQIVAELDKYIVGQAAAKRAVGPHTHDSAEEGHGHHGDAVAEEDVDRSRAGSHEPPAETEDGAPDPVLPARGCEALLRDLHRPSGDRSGVEPRDQLDADRAVLESVRTRIRPIFMTTTTTVFGLAPLVFVPGAGNELYRGLGSVVLGGLVVSTLFTLVLVPTLFSLMLDLRQLASGLMPGVRRVAMRDAENAAAIEAVRIERRSRLMLRRWFELNTAR